MKAPHVAICLPTVGTVRDQTAVALARLTAHTVQRSVASLKMDLVSGCAAVAWARNMLVRRAQASHVDAILFIDHDMDFPRDALERLLSWGADVCGVLYNKRHAEFDCVGRLIDPERSIESGGIAEVDELGAGLMLVRSSVFQRIPPPWFEFKNDPDYISDENPFGEMSEDIVFVRKCRAAGIKVYADLDLSMEMGHIGARVIRWQRSGYGVPDLREDAV